MKFSILTGLAAVSTVFASVVREPLDVSAEYENHVAGDQWQDVNNLNQSIMLQGAVGDNKKRYEYDNDSSGFSCLNPVSKSVATITMGNLRYGCVGGSINPDYEIFMGLLCAFSDLKLDKVQPNNGVRACTISPKTGKRWCGSCFAHDDAAPRPSISVWNKLNKPQQASVCLQTIVHTVLSGFQAKSCVNTLATSIYGQIGVHSYISN
ncbi:hypothetical protein AYI68_g6655 [Smittium mucronatum]|uniref:Uncharacterized protein n=1 Tax=Smittium mucronatum TaxID=133383 RepID=A0A1R0GQV9_9FUNG|nr:hypothetical protein AYI68_g6655 [Smittium mucronatum]